MTTEQDIQTAIRLEASRRGLTLWRNNTGKIQDRDGRWHVFGLCRGGSDLVGYTPVTITPEHVGQTLAVFTAIEVKTLRGRVTPEQQQFIDTVAAAGGIAHVCRSPDDL